MIAWSAWCATSARTPSTTRSCRKTPAPRSATRVAEAALQAVSARPDAPCALVFDCSGGELRVTVAGQTFTQPLIA